MNGEAQDDDETYADSPGDPLSRDYAEPAAPGGALFEAVGALCETATRRAGVDGAAVAAVMSTTSRELIYATDALAERIDELQFTVGEGPCLAAYTSHWPQLCPDLDAVGPRFRWLAFSAGVQELGVRAVFAFPVPGWKAPLGVLELYRRAPGALDDHQLAHASAGAEAIGHEVLTRLPEVASPAESALHAEAALLHPSNPFTRADVYVASGLVASQLDVSTDDALARIRAHAFARGMDLTATAADIVSGRLKLPAADR